MSAVRHLILQEICLRPSGEWMPGGGWTVVRVAEGAGYCLQPGAARELNPGDAVVVGAHASATFRASQLGVLKLEYFHVLTQCLNGLLTVTEWQQLEDASSRATARLLFFNANEPTAQKFTRLAAQSQRDGLAARSALLQLWASSITGLFPSASIAPVANNLRERFRQFVGKMSEAELAVRPLPQLAEELHCSERHFSRLFREEFHISLRSRQTELRLQRARQLLVESDSKIINVALESGYRHLGLFNAMFKKRFGVTPSQWRQQNVKSLNRSSVETAKRPGPDAPPAPPPRFNVGLLLAFFVAFFFMRHAFADSTNAPAAQPPPATNSVQHFTVKNYLIMGNTLLTPKQIQQALTNVPSAFGTNVTIDDIRSLMGELLMAYRERGFVTVSIFPPSGQKLTNATVKLQVTEGRISDIKVTDNKFFSTPNVLRALPSLDANMMLNSHVFQAELDRANANRDRQIYPTIGPGPDPGTTELTLKVKDRLPLHARAELNNITTPGTPDTRAFFSAQYNNLWQLEHQAGFSYSFSPVNFHGEGGDYYWWPLDLPSIGNYSAYYRIPLGSQKSVQQQIDESNGKFGYNEVSHQFQMPPPSGRPELTIYASRSVVDTAIKFSNYKTIIAPTNPLLSIISFDTGQNITANGDVGGKFSWPLPQWGRLASTLSAGMDFKHFQQSSYNSNNFVATTLFTNTDGSVTPIQSLVSSGQPILRTEIYYLPMNVGVNASIPDSWGQTFFNAQANFNLATISGRSQTIASENVTYTNKAGVVTNRTITVTKMNRGGFSVVSGDRTVHDGFITLQMGMDRQQRIYKDWNVKFHADGQWANGHLFSNEQFGMGGSVGVRGYQDGEVYSDAGWRMSIEPQTPLIQFGEVDGGVPVWFRGSIFVDYGQAIQLGGAYFPHYANPGGGVLPHTKADPRILDFLGAGWSISANIGSHLDGRFTMAFPLDNPGYLRGWSPVDYVHVYFILGAQF